MIMDSNYNSGYNKGSYNFHYQKDNKLVAYSTESERAAFYRKTYTHVALAILAFILVETALFRLIPPYFIEDMFAAPFIALMSYTEVLWQAVIITLSLFTGITTVVFMTRLDFSFLRSVLIIGGFLSLGLIVAGVLFGNDVGLWFSIGMVAFAAGSILYETYRIKNKYTTEQYVGAALQLFASVMVLFWYVLKILSRFPRGLR